MTMCFVCELDHGDGCCPDCEANNTWRAKTAKEQQWRKNSKARKKANG